MVSCVGDLNGRNKHKKGQRKNKEASSQKRQRKKTEEFPLRQFRALSASQRKVLKFAR